MQNNTRHANWENPYSFMLKETYRVGERWWGSRTEKFQSFWAEPCLMIQLSVAWPWLRVATGFRLRTIGLYDGHIATVSNSCSAAKLLTTVLADIKTFPVLKDSDGFSADPFGDAWEDGPPL